ncbi:hypothetical protein BDY19DRAFT_860621, partial [Irpex rosettiformis]
MKLSKAFGILYQLAHIVRIAFLPTLREITRTPWILAHPTQLSQLFMSFVWGFFGDVLDENSKGVKESLITPYAHGVVLDIGAGHGHTVNYLDVTKVTKYIALEPNPHMHVEIRKKATLSVGFSEDKGNFILLPFGAEETGLIVSALGGVHSADTLISILTLCSVPEPEIAIPGLVHQALRPGGTLLYLEHVQSDRDDVAWWQRFWAPVWKAAFGGCTLGRPTDIIIERLNVWERKEIVGFEGEDQESLIVHSIGRLMK